MVATLNSNAWVSSISITMITLAINGRGPAFSDFITDIYRVFPIFVLNFMEFTEFRENCAKFSQIFMLILFYVQSGPEDSMKIYFILI